MRGKRQKRWTSEEFGSDFHFSKRKSANAVLVFHFSKKMSLHLSWLLKEHNLLAKSDIQKTYNAFTKGSD